jgi:hypothetical protein
MKGGGKTQMSVHGEKIAVRIRKYGGNTPERNFFTFIPFPRRISVKKSSFPEYTCMSMRKV